MAPTTHDFSCDSATPARAMRAVMESDREAWLNCFSKDALLRDPVGGSPLDPDGTGLQGQDALGRFWDAVIAPAESVHFDVSRSFPSGSSVAKVATVRIAFPASAPIEYDGVFVYDLADDGRIQALSGYFSLPGAS